MTKHKVKISNILKGVYKMKKIVSMSLISIGLCLGTHANASDYTMTPDGNYVKGSTYTMTPDGNYVGGSTYNMAPDGSYKSGNSSTLAPNGQYIGR